MIAERITTPEKSPSPNGHGRYAKILEIGPIAPPHAGWGVRIGYVLEALKSRDVQTAALDVGPTRKIKRPHCDTVHSSLDYARKVFRYLRSGYRIHTHLNGESPKAYALVLYSTILSWMFRRRAVLTWHGGLGYRFFPSNGNPLVDTIHRTIFRLSERVICNDEIIKRKIMEYGVPEDKVVPIPAFSPQYLEFDRVELSAEIQRFLADHRPTLFCYTYYRPEFYLPELVTALRTLVDGSPRLGLVLVGYTAGSEPIRRRLREEGLENNVCLAGNLGRNEFLTLLEQCDLCVRTHQRDGISSSVLEALALGVPVVAADNPLRPPQVWTYPAEDPAALAQRVQEVLSLPPDARRPQSPEILDTVADEVAILTGSPAAG